MRSPLIVIVIAVLGVVACKNDPAGKAAGKDPASPGPVAGARTGEVTLMLNRIGKSAKVYFVTNGAFPVGKAGPTPGAACCAQPTHKCTPDQAAWSGDPIWSALDFSIDEPFSSQYSYTGTATEFTATAISDLDCDEDMVTTTAHGTVDTAGGPAVEFSTSGTE